MANAKHYWRKVLDTRLTPLNNVVNTYAGTTTQFNTALLLLQGGHLGMHRSKSFISTMADNIFGGGFLINSTASELNCTLRINGRTLLVLSHSHITWVKKSRKSGARTKASPAARLGSPRLDDQSNLGSGSRTEPEISFHKASYELDGGRGARLHAFRLAPWATFIAI